MRHHKKDLPSRRKTAVRWGIILAVLVCFTSVCRLYLFLPVQARLLAEEASNTGRTDLICREWHTDGDGERLLISLSRKGDTVLLSGASCHLLTGWIPEFDYAYDCRDADLSGSVTLEGAGSLATGFLRIGDPAIETVTVSVMALGKEREESGERIRVEIARLTTTQDAWTGTDDGRYALFTMDVEDAIGTKNALYGPLYLQARAFDCSGAVAAEYDSYAVQQDNWPW